MADGTELRLSDRNSGDGWMSAQLDPVASGAAGCHIQFSAGSPLVAAMVAGVASDDPSGRVSAADSLVTLTLSGEVDWTVVSAVWRAAKALWEVVPYDEGAGFAVDLDEL
ncbi:hypothetical protein AB0F15_25660 [Amycolatopsis sp. NPDC026612]|uniref:hypothetical protein n=1 Tax=Amycolatopsis sp. NPDC026612 TaxID=3155466 RepID=UPI0033D90A47